MAQVGGGFSALANCKVVALTTYRRNGDPVTTPVNVVVVGDKAYVLTTVERGKANRVRNDPRVRIAPATLRGRVTGPEHPGTARVMDDGETATAAAAFKKKYLLASRFHAVQVRMAREHPVFLEVTPAD